VRPVLRTRSSSQMECDETALGASCKQLGLTRAIKSAGTRNTPTCNIVFTSKFQETHDEHQSITRTSRLRPAHYLKGQDLTPPPRPQRAQRVASSSTNNTQPANYCSILENAQTKPLIDKFKNKYGQTDHTPSLFAKIALKQEQEMAAP
jgi:hypothetical protein